MKFKNLFKYVLTIFVVMGAFSADAMDKGKQRCVPCASAEKQEKIVISFDLDDVMSAKGKVGAWDYSGLSRVIFSNPVILSAFWHFSEISEQGKETASGMNGTSNVVHAMIAKLKEQGYGDLSPYEDEIIQLSIKPTPIKDMVDIVNAYKEAGYEVIGGTNQDVEQYYNGYRPKMLAQGVDMDTLFDAVLTTPVNHKLPADAAKEKIMRYKTGESTLSKNVYVTTEVDAFKPSPKYFLAVQALAKRVSPQVTRVIHIDDNEDNYKGVLATRGPLRMDGVHFKLEAGSARKSKPEQLKRTIDGFKKDMQELGVPVPVTK